MKPLAFADSVGVSRVRVRGRGVEGGACNCGQAKEVPTALDGGLVRVGQGTRVEVPLSRGRGACRSSTQRESRGGGHTRESHPVAPDGVTGSPGVVAPRGLGLRPGRGQAYSALANHQDVCAGHVFDRLGRICRDGDCGACVRRGHSCDLEGAHQLVRGPVAAGDRLVAAGQRLVGLAL